jgi:hypothetical protein
MATVSIPDQLKALLELQGLDAQLYQLKAKQGSIPQQATALKAQSKEASAALQVLEQQHKGFEVKRNQMEMDLGQKEAQIKKLQGQLFQVKTNKEYSAFQKEIEGLKADKSVLEEEILKLMEEIDRVKGQVESQRQALKAKEAQIAQDLARLDQEMKSLEASIQQFQQSRLGLTPKVDPSVLSQYERILERKEGLALVPVRKGACGGCHMVLPPQMVNEIQMSGRLITCESCARILYVDPATS